MKEKRYVRPTIGGWLRPALFAPWLSTYATLSLFAVFAPAEILPRWATWAMLMLLGSVFAGAYVLLSIVLDVALLGLRQRILPTGAPAWKMSLLSPAVVLVSYLFVRPHGYWRAGPWAVTAAVVVPLLIGVVAGRLVAGSKTHTRS